MYEIQLDDNKRVIAYNKPPLDREGWITVEELPEDYNNYLYIDGALVYSPLPTPEPEPTADDILGALLGIGGNANE